MRAADRLGGHLGEAEVAHLAGLHLLGHDADGFFDGDFAVAPVLVPEIDVVGAEALQTALERAPHIFRAAVDAGDLAVYRDTEAELGGDDRTLAAARERLRQENLVGARAVDLGGIQKIDAEVKRATDGRDALRFVRSAVHIGHPGDAGHPHGAEADRRDFETLAAELASLHA